MCELLCAVCQQRELRQMSSPLLGLLLHQPTRLFLQFRTSLNRSKNSFVCDICTGICGENCALCCAVSPYSSGQCMRTADGVHLDSAACCWTIYESLSNLSTNSAAAPRSWSSTSSYSPQSHTRNRESNDEHTNHGAVWRGAGIGVVALIILVVVLTRFSPCLKTQVTSRELEEQQIAVQTPSDAVPVSSQNAKYAHTNEVS